MRKETSTENYIKVKETGMLQRVQFLVYETIYKFGPITQNEVVEAIRKENPSLQKPSITPRFSELERMLAIAAIGTPRQCTISGKTCATWDLTDKMPVNVKKVKSGKARIKELEDAIEKLIYQANHVAQYSTWWQMCKILNQSDARDGAEKVLNSNEKLTDHR